MKEKRNIIFTVVCCFGTCLITHQSVNASDKSGAEHTVMKIQTTQPGTGRTVVKQQLPQPGAGRTVVKQLLPQPGAGRTVVKQLLPQPGAGRTVVKQLLPQPGAGRTVVKQLLPQPGAGRTVVKTQLPQPYNCEFDVSELTALTLRVDGIERQSQALVSQLVAEKLGSFVEKYDEAIEALGKKVKILEEVKQVTPDDIMDIVVNMPAFISMQSRIEKLEKDNSDLLYQISDLSARIDSVSRRRSVIMSPAPVRASTARLSIGKRYCGTPSKELRRSIGFIDKDAVRQVEEDIEGHEEVFGSLEGVTTLSKANLDKISAVIVKAMKATGMDRETVINAISNKLENKVYKGKTKLQLDTIKATITTHEIERDAATLVQRDTAAASLEQANAELEKRQPKGRGQGSRRRKK